jgi:diguanylate cyclase (GGDEF)-like protein
MDGVHAGQVHGMDELPLTVGRHPSNRVRVEDPSISRFHARILRQGNGWVLEDLGSQNRSYVGRQVAQREEIRDGQIVRFGPRVSFRFALADQHQQRLLRQLYESSTRDALTGAYNRRHFNDRLSAELAYALRHDANVALILIDIDHFKQINDTWGHPAGDAVLKRVAHNLQLRLRTEDLFARYGGEEFGVLLRGVHLAGATRLAERLRTTVAAVPTVWRGKPIPVTVSAGCATLRCGAPRSESGLLDTADRRLYLAKKRGRNRVISAD